MDVGGNVKFLDKDSVEEIKDILQGLVDCPEEYQKLLCVAEGEGKEQFSYKKIAKRAIEI